MSTDIAAFRGRAESTARSMLVSMVGEERATQSAGRVALAFDSSVRSAKDPSALLSCSPSSIGAAIAMSALTELYPGGPNPDVYLVPRKGALSWEITHRGIAKVAARLGYQIVAVPVHRADEIEVELGEVKSHRTDPSRSPTGEADLLGVAVVVRVIATGAILCRPWVPGGVIAARSKAQGAGPVWRTWYVEMAIKTAIKYCAARGMLPITGAEWDAALTEPEPEHTEVKAPPARGVAALGMSHAAPVVEVVVEPEPEGTEQAPGDDAPWDEPS